MRLYVGTSGYGYKEWKGKFYPESISSAEMLSFYSAHFDTVEINNTFYRMPTPQLLETWAEQVPERFVFALKAPRIITHIKRLKNVGKETEYFVKTAAILGKRLGPILFQLPPTLSNEPSRLRDFLRLLPPGAAAFEFRNRSWLNEEVLSLLQEQSFPWCISDQEPDPAQEVPRTAQWGYLRLRRSDYSDSEFAAWHAKLLYQKWETAYVFFKHEGQAGGPGLAARFLKIGDTETRVPSSSP